MGSKRRLLVIGGCVAAAAISFVPPTHASQSFDNQRGDIAARVSMQNTFQHNNASSINWVQMRNEVRFDLRYDLIEQGKGQTFGPVNALKFNILWRGRYDTVYDARGAYRDRDYNRGNFQFPEGKTPRELFFDIGFGGALKDLSLRIGKQQVVWGEADLFRSLDVVNPLDLTQSGFVGEDFADFRRPLWIAKGLYTLGDVASFWNEAGIETFFSPNARPFVNQDNLLVQQTYKIGSNQGIIPIPGNEQYGGTRWVATNFRQVRHPWEFLRVGAKKSDSPAVPMNPGGTHSDFMYRIKNDVSNSEVALSSMMAGVRLLGTTYGNAYFTLNYLFKRTDGSTSEVGFSQIFDNTKPGTGSLQPDVLARAVNALGTPDLNGNGIPDGQEEQLINCIRSAYPKSKGFAGSANPLGAGPMTTDHAGELILDPGTGNASNGDWHGSVYSPIGQPVLQTGVQNNAINPATGRPFNQLKSDNVSYTVKTDPRAVNPIAQDPDGLVHSSACLDVPVQHNWTHIVGGTMTYNDYEYTGLVFRLEQSLSSKEGRQDSPSSAGRLLEYQAGKSPIGPTARDFATRANRYTQVWRSMVGFDYLRAIAPQFGHSVGNPLLHSLLTDQWFFTFQFLNQYDAHADHVNSSASFTNRFQHFNPFFTVSGSGFFMNQRLRPTWAVALDTNQMTPLVFAQIQYFLTPKLEMRLGEVLYLGSSHAEDNGGLFYYADRDTFYARFTYYLA